MRRKVAILSATALLGVMLSSVHGQIVSELERGGAVSWEFLGGVFTVSGAITTSGQVNSSPPVVLRFEDLNNDGLALDVHLDLGELVPEFNIEYQIDLIANVIQDGSEFAIIEWTAFDNPNRCVEIEIEGFGTVQALVTEASAKLRGYVSRISCASDPLGALPHNPHLQITMTGGSQSNYARLKGYLFCLEDPSAYTELELIGDWIAYGGGLPKSLGNVNGDCIIDDADLLQVLFDFGSNNPNTDTNGDGVVDDADLLTVLFNFGLSV